MHPVIDDEPNLHLYQLTRFFVGTEPLSIALDGAFPTLVSSVSLCARGDSKAIK